MPPAPDDALRLAADPAGEPLLEESREVEAIHVAIGPEGGFDDTELAAFQTDGWRRVSLGKRILRVETAAVAMAALAGRALGG